jgi:hypothetical protein
VVVVELELVVVLVLVLVEVLVLVDVLVELELVVVVVGTVQVDPNTKPPVPHMYAGEGLPTNEQYVGSSPVVILTVCNTPLQSVYCIIAYPRSPQLEPASNVTSIHDLTVVVVVVVGGKVVVVVVVAKVLVVVVVGASQQVSKLMKLTFPILITPYVLSTQINSRISSAVCVTTSVDPQGTYATLPGFILGPTNLYLVQGQGTAVGVVVVVAPQHPSNVVLILVMLLLILII